MSISPGQFPTATKLPHISGHKGKQISKFSPQATNIYESLLGKLGQGSSSSLDYLMQLAGGDEGAFQQSEQPAYTAFEKLLGQTGSRFSHLGARDSSYFQNAVAGAGGELAENIQGRRSSIMQQAIEALLNHSQQLLGNNPYQNIYQARSPGTNWGSIIGTGVGAIGGGLLGGPPGAAAGAGIGGGIGGSFGKNGNSGGLQDSFGSLGSQLGNAGGSYFRGR